MSLDNPLLRAFEAAAVDPARFRHREHLYVAWCYLRVLPLEEALPRYLGHLRRLTAALGVPEKFHATMSWAYLVLLDDAMHDAALAGADFEALVARYPSLFDHKSGLLYEHYDRAQLDSPEARRRFVLPRRPR